MAPVVQELARYTHQIESRICVTAQHREMLDQVLDLFDLEPDYDLAVMEDNQTPTQVASTVLERLEPILQQEEPDWVLVQGDTTTVAAASLAAFYARAKVGHVEAGLRTHNKWQPFPEEINRQLAGVIADMHFAPTDQARQNLLQEDVHDERILVTGNPVIDALQWVADQPFEPADLDDETDDLARVLAEHDNGKTVLVTAHRRENHGQPLARICRALQEIANRYDGDLTIVYPVHLNPNVWKPAHHFLEDVSNIMLTPPLDYQPLVHLMKRSHLVLTDSGGIQEEAPGLGVPVLVLRDVTERPEAIKAGTAQLVGTDQERIVAETCRLLDDPEEYEAMAQSVNPYGDGQASRRIVRALLNEPVEQFSPYLSKEHRQ
jgi:UDP-N-acetylglucosamine 2-epimerase (non-hydrolysing)